MIKGLLAAMVFVLAGLGGTLGPAPAATGSVADGLPRCCV